MSEVMIDSGFQPKHAKVIAYAVWVEQMFEWFHYCPACWENARAMTNATLQADAEITFLAGDTIPCCMCSREIG